MRTLTPEEKKFLVDYCMERKENTWLALAIGQIQPELRKAIVSPFLKELDESIREKLEECHHCQWETKIPETNLEGNSIPIYIMTVRGIEMQLRVWGGGYLLVGPPKELDLGRDEIVAGLNVKLLSNNKAWWFNAERHIKSFEDLSTLSDDEVRREKIEYFTHIFVCLAKNISKALEA